MKIHRIYDAPDRALLAEVAACVASSGTLIFPTDTVYGIGCAPEDEWAIDALYSAKRRPAEKPLAIHIASARDADAYAARLTAGARVIIGRFWPGPVAVIVERRAERAAYAARNGTTISLRCPDDATCMAILRATGPLAATSANVSAESAFTGDDADIAHLPWATMAVVAGPTRQRRESTVLDCSGESVRVVRAGALDLDVIARSLRGVAPLVR